MPKQGGSPTSKTHNSAVLSAQILMMIHPVNLTDWMFGKKLRRFLDTFFWLWHDFHITWFFYTAQIFFHGKIVSHSVSFRRPSIYIPISRVYVAIYVGTRYSIEYVVGPPNNRSQEGTAVAAASEEKKSFAIWCPFGTFLKKFITFRLLGWCIEKERKKKIASSIQHSPPKKEYRIVATIARANLAM